MNVFLRVIGVLIFWSVASQAADAPQKIDVPGLYDLFDDQLVVSVEAKNGKIGYTVGNRQIQAGSTEQDFFQATLPWFIWPESPTTVWSFHGTGPLRLITISEWSVAVDNSSDNPSILDRAPKPVLELFRRDSK